MATTLHLAYLIQDSLANLQDEANASNLKKKQWYWDETNDKPLVAISDSEFGDPLAGGGVQSFTDTPTIEWTDLGGGDFSADIILDPASDNILEATNDGLYVPQLTVESNSQQYIKIENGQLEVKPLLIISVTVDDNATDLDDWISSNYTQGDEKQEGDLLILTAPTDKEVWIHNGGTAGTAADFSKVNTDDIDDAYIRTLFSAGDGLSYNSSTGEFELALSSDSGNALSFGSDDGLFLSQNVLIGSADSGANNPIAYGATLNISGGHLLNTSFAGGTNPTFSIGISTAGASTGQVITYNGSQPVWDDPAAGLEWWEEGRNTSGVNASKHVHFWQPDSNEANVDLAMIPRGNGGFMLSIPDGTATGGNKRGNYAVDLQTERNQAGQVAGAGNSAVLGGFANRADGNYSVALGGRVNVAGGNYSIAGGYASQATHAGSLILSDDRSSSTQSTQVREARFAYENRFNVISNLFETSGNAAFGNDENAANVTIFSQGSTNQALTLDHYGAQSNNNKSEIRWAHQGTRRYSIGLDSSDMDDQGFFSGNDWTLRSYEPDGTTVHNTVIKYRRISDNLDNGSRLGFFTSSPLHAKVDIAGDLRVRTINQDDNLEQILVKDSNGVIKYRAIGTFPGATGSTNIFNTSGTLTGNRTLDFDGNTLTYRNTSNNNVVRFQESGSTIQAILGDIEVLTENAGLILKSNNGSRFRITVTDYGALEANPL